MLCASSSPNARLCPARTIPSIVHAHAAVRPNATALEVWDEEDGVSLTVSYAQLSKNVRSAAGFLAHVSGLQRGDRCALHSHNNVAYVCASLGAMELGATSVNLSWRQPDNVNLELLAGLGAKLLLASRALSALAERAQRELPSVRVMLFDSICATPLHQALPFGTEPAHMSPPAVAPDEENNAEHATAVIFFTGGTTGTPKAVPHSYASLLANIDGYLREHGQPLDPAAEPRAGSVCFTPYFHVMGYVCCLLVNLVAGCRSAMLADPDARLSPALMLKACAALRPTVCHTVPWVVEGFATLINNGDANTAAELSRLRLLTYGGAALPVEHAQALSEAGVTLQCAYGQTELCGPVLYGQKGAVHPVYRPLEGIRYELVPREDDGPDEGELVLLGAKAATRGYLRTKVNGGGGDEGPLEHGDNHERYRTRDRFRRVTVDGLSGTWLRYLCRTDDLLVHTSGEMTNPLITEQTVMAESRGLLADAGATLCGTGMPRPILVLELRKTPDGAAPQPADAPTRATLRAAVDAANALQPKYSAVLTRNVWLVPPGALPRTVKGNVQRLPVEEMLRSGKLPEGSYILDTEGDEGKVRMLQHSSEPSILLSHTAVHCALSLFY